MTESQTEPDSASSVVCGDPRDKELLLAGCSSVEVQKNTSPDLRDGTFERGRLRHQEQPSATAGGSEGKRI